VNRVSHLVAVTLVPHVAVYGPAVAVQYTRMVTVMHWSHGYTDRLMLLRDGTHLEGTHGTVIVTGDRRWRLAFPWTCGGGFS
jgi:hypothetical protein